MFSLSKAARTLHCTLATGLFALLLGGRSGLSQATTGQISGVISDTSGAVVPGVNVVAVDEAKQTEFPSRTRGDGQYLILDLPPGTYSVTTTKAGFNRLVKSRLHLDIDEKLRVDLTLRVGDISSEIQVTADAVAIQTQSPETGQVIGARQVSDLPLLGRNFLDLTLLTPGVVAGTGSNNASYSVNGQREFSNSILVNGIEVTGNRNNDTSIRPSVDSVEEFKALTSTYSPEFGRASGGVIAVQTKSGTNSLHGSLYEFLRTNATTARTFFAPEPSALKQNNFGATIGGPIIRNRTFFFLGYEGIRTRDNISSLLSTVPFDQVRVLPGGGVDLSGLRDPATGNQIPIFDPAYYTANGISQQFPNNIIPGDRVSPAGLNVLQNLFPKPNRQGGSFGWVNNFASSQRVREDRDIGDLRIDHSISSKDRLTGTYDLVDFRGQTDDPYGNAIPIFGGGSGDGANLESSRNQALGITESHIFTPTLLNEFRFTLVRADYAQNDLIHGTNAASKLGIGNVNIPGFPATSGLPQIQLAFGPITGGSTFKPLSFADHNYQYADNLSWVLGRHALKFGYEFRSIQVNPNFTLFPTGYQYYNGAFGSLTSDPTNTYSDPLATYGTGGNEIADLLLGLPGFEQQGIQFNQHRATSYEHEFYGQDTWQVTSNLVLTFGVRYEFKNPYVEVNNYQSNFDPATLSILLAGRGGNSRSLIQPDKNNFSPRLGIAYRVDPKTSIRAGFGLFYTPEDSARSEQLSFNYPFAVQQQFVNATGTAPTFQLDVGVPRPTSIPVDKSTARIDSTTIPFSSVQSYFYIDPNYRTGYSEQFNLTVQHQIGSEFIAEAGYVGTLGRKLPLGIGNLNAGGLLSSNVGPVQGQAPDGFSSYHSLQAKFEKRFAKGYSLLASYTFAKNIDNGGPVLYHGPDQGPQDPFNRRAEKALSSIDVRHNFTMSQLWELPIGRGKRFLPSVNAVGQAVLGGWQINNILVMHTGLPENITRDLSNPACGSLRPDVSRNPNLDRGQRTLAQYFDIGAFTIPSGNSCPIGSAGRNIVFGPGFINLDSSLFKEFTLRESLIAQLRIEAFNITNTAHFGNPNSDASQLRFGSVTGTIANPRIMQFALKVRF